MSDPLTSMGAATLHTSYRPATGSALPPALGRPAPEIIRRPVLGTPRSLKGNVVLRPRLSIRVRTYASTRI
ncbi:hypothetical protein GCM10009546_64510 [Actinomadura livida]|uniref:Uncharacterized protein n=1 Tax=Actinomadura livida TaxID=79909 RepID=A0ABN1FLG3_9ACTN|nr:hypothetical protein GCM10010208_11840 [Actinomadura livida]